MASASAAPGTHAVQFYDSEPFIHQAIAEFFTQGAHPDDPLIMLARLRTFKAVASHLASGGNGSAINAADRIRFFDAEAALPEIMEGESLDPDRAEGLLMHILAQSCPSHARRPIRLYGELVDMLCERGCHSAAIELEGLWCSLLDPKPQISILCGYAVERFKDGSAAQLRAVCQKHTQVIPAESFAGAPDDRLFATQPPAPMRMIDGIAPVQSVYVVDDDASIRRSLRRLLTAYGWPVRTFDSAEAFLAELDKLSSGCLVVDIGLQGISGLELADRLTDSRPSWPIIVMSGLYDKKSESDALRLGARAYLRKPFASQSVLNAIARAAARAR
jgi:CheY-like chemotaxis protein